MQYVGDLPPRTLCEQGGQDSTIWLSRTPETDLERAERYGQVAGPLAAVGNARMPPAARQGGAGSGPFVRNPSTALLDMANPPRAKP